MSVINQVLKDLESIDAKPVDRLVREYSHIEFNAGSKKTVSQVLTWGLLLVAALVCYLTIIKHSELGYAYQAGDYRYRVAELVELADAANSSSLAEAAWQSTAEGEAKLVFIFEGDKPLETQKIDLSNGKTEYIFSDSQLGSVISETNIADKFVDVYTVDKREQDIVLTLKPKSGVTVSDALKINQDGKQRYYWKLKAVPKAETIVADAEAIKDKQREPKLILSSKKSSTIAKNTNSIKKPAAILLNVDQEYQRALLSIRSGKIVSAIERLKRILRTKSKFHSARELLANLYFRSGREAEAFMLLDQGIQLDSNYMPFVFLYAQVLIQRNRLNEAKNILLAATPAEKSAANYYALLAVVTQRLNQHQEAISYYMKSLELDASQGESWMGMAISLEALNKLEAAAGAYSEAKVAGSLKSELVAYIDSRLQHLEFEQ